MKSTLEIQSPQVVFYAYPDLTTTKFLKCRICTKDHDVCNRLCV